MKTDDELKKIAIDMYEGHVFSTEHIREEDINLVPVIFMPLALMNQEQLEGLSDVSIVYEDKSRAGPRAVNGYPSFMSMQTLNKDEAAKMWHFFDTYKAMKEDFMEKDEQEESVDQVL